MKGFKNNLAVRNLIRRPGRSGALTILAVFLSFSIFAGTLVIISLQSGLHSLQDRLGADVMVVPYQAKTQSKLEDIILQGNTGYFYMNKSCMDHIAQLDGIRQISPQFYLASVGASCCSIPVQIIGYDPATDFTVAPWVKKNHKENLKDMEVIVGNDLNAFAGDTLQFYGTTVNVVDKLDRTGTHLDTAVYTNVNTIKTLIRSSLDKKMNDFQEIDPEKIVSCVLINVADGYTAEEVVNDINLHVKGVEAIHTRTMISGVSSSLQGVSGIIGILIGAIWILAVVIMIIVYTLSAGERKREFAVLRVLGASRKKLSMVLLEEAVLISFVGSSGGLLLGLVVILPFSHLIEAELGLPFLLPGGGKIVVLALVAWTVATIAGALTSAIASYRISRIDTGLILREV